MSFSRLLEIIHSATPVPDWTKANKEVFEGLLAERYPKAAEKAIKLRAPEMPPPVCPSLLTSLSIALAPVGTVVCHSLFFRLQMDRVWLV